MVPSCHMSTHLTENLKVRLDTESLRALERLAEEGDRTVAAEIRRAIRAHIARKLGAPTEVTQ